MNQKDRFELSHIDSDGSAKMVDISDKAITDRTATASCRVIVGPSTLSLIKEKSLKKGDVLSIARLAGIMGAKKTSDLIPLCHPLNLTSIEVELNLDLTGSSIEVLATAKISGKTGVEMEALTAVTIAALTIYDMVKAVDKATSITDIRLLHKAGGKSTDYISN
ncbi:MAG: cyclic pyranopterin monophosphate synthase MoaC [Alphaproteobacteria bacterium]|nr:cyclic pyranopterin monophosphate synthase MoaC [Alphaproteobacteria bacterium]|tara:strand:- start:240 stop:731 length:492 start_codon:yes stop_codon:yes gene_type:complete